MNEQLTLEQKMAKRVGAMDQQRALRLFQESHPLFHQQGNFTACVIPITDTAFAIGIAKRTGLLRMRKNGKNKLVGDLPNQDRADTIARARAYRDLANKMLLGGEEGNNEGA